MAASTECIVRIAAPFDLVWDMTNDIESWTELFSEYTEATVLEREGNRVLFRLTMHPDENGKQWSWVSERLADRQRGIVHARRVETGPFEYMNIHWYYTDLGGPGVEMRWVQEFEMKPGAPVDDAGMAARIRTNTPVQMYRIRERIESVARASA